MSLIHLTINGQAVEASSGDTILQAARRAGIRIPTLCYHPALPTEESCRICVVEMVRGRWSSQVAACVYPAREGMVIETDTDQVIKTRKTILELILSDHPLDCLTCNSTGNCELQDLAYEYGIKESRLIGESHVYPVDSDPNRYIHWDMNKCIMCRRCIRACSQIQCAHVLTKADRGFNQRISTAFGNPLEQSDCEFDGQCLAFCPVDALSEKAARRKGRAWEMTRTTTICPLCACGCLTDLHHKGSELIKITSNFASPANEGALCFRGRFRYTYLNKPERLSTPLLKKGNAWVEIGWREALETMAAKIRTLQQTYGPQSLALLLSPSATNEELFLWKEFSRIQLKTDKISQAGASVWTPGMEVLEKRLGRVGATNPTADLMKSAGILVVGSHLLESHPIVAIRVRQSMQQGAELMILEDKPQKFARNPRLTLTTAPQHQAALIRGLLALLLQQNRLDQAYLTDRTTGLDGLRETLQRIDPDQVAEEIGLSRSLLEQGAAFIADHHPLSVICPSPNTPGETFSPALVEGLVTLQLLRGNLGRPGGGLYCLPPQSNNLGAWVLGAVRADYTEKDLLAEVAAETVKGLLILAEDPQGQSHLTPEQVKQLKTLAAGGFLAVQDLFLSEAAQQADLVLPARSYAEKTGTFMNLERRIQWSEASPSEAKTPPWAGDLLARLASGLGLDFPATSPAQTFIEITRAYPDWAGMRYERLAAGGLQWPCPREDHPGTPILFEAGFSPGVASLAFK